MTKKTLIIAEVGTSHQGNIKKAKELVRTACEAGADCIKFQWVYADEILHPKTGIVKLPTGAIPLYERFKQFEVPKKFFSELKSYVHAQGKTFMCSPFGERSLKELMSIKPDYIKIASPELNHIPLLQCLLKLEQEEKKPIPIVLSSGVSTLHDIKNAVKLLDPLVKDNLVSLLHCVTSYPAPVQDYNLKLIPFLKERFNINIGVSDHSLDPLLVPILSLACGGTIVEKHITLSNNSDGLDDPVALEPENFARMVSKIRAYENLDKKTILEMLKCSYDDKTINATLGTGKKELAQSERANYGRTNRSIHYMRDMKQGEVITENDIAVLRTEKKLTVGIEPIYYEQVLHKELARDVHDGSGLLWEHIT